MIKTTVQISPALLEKINTALEAAYAGHIAGILGTSENPYFKRCHTVRQLMLCRHWQLGYHSGQRAIGEPVTLNFQWGDRRLGHERRYRRLSLD